MNDTVTWAETLRPWMPLVMEWVVMPALFLFIPWLVSIMPGPIRNWLQSGTHQRDMALLTGAMLRKAMDSFGTVPNAQLPQVLIDYAKTELKDTVGKLRPSPEALLTIATAAARQVATGLGTVTAGTEK